MIATTLRKLSVGLLIGLLGFLLSFSSAGVRWEEDLGLAWLYKVRGPVEAPPGVAIINMDAESAAALDQPAKIRDWQRDVHARLIDKLLDIGVSAIVFDVFFELPKEPDSQLASSMRRAQRVALVQHVERKRVDGIVIDTLHDPVEALRYASTGLAPFPLPKVPNRVSQFWGFSPNFGPTLPLVAFQIHVIQAMGYADFLALLKSGGITGSLPTAAATAGDLRELIEVLHAALQKDSMHGLRLIQQISNQPGLPVELRKSLISLVHAYLAPGSQYIKFYGPQRTIETVQYKEVLEEDKLLLQELAGKSVFVGSIDPTPFSRDSFHTVFSGEDGTDLSGVEIGATVFANLLNDDSLIYPGTVLSMIGLVGFGLLVGSAAYLLRGVPVAFAATLGLGLAYLASAHYFFHAESLWLPIVVPLLVQVPLALIVGLLLQYLESRRKTENASRALRYHVPDSVARKLIDKSTLLMPERVYGTCMLSDVADFTTMSEEMEPEELASRCNDYFASIGECITNHNGEILEIVGDGLTSVWATPEQNRQVRLQACLAALDSLQAVEKFNAQHTDFPFATRIGLDSGWLAMGYLGGSGHYTYGVAGDIANTASRIEGLSKYLGTSLLASENVVEGLAEKLLLRPLGRFLFKGKKNAMNVVEIVCRHEHAMPENHALNNQFKTALDLFAGQHWLESSKSFSALASRFPVDGPTEFYRQRSLQYVDDPPAVEDGGFIRLESK